MKDIDGFLNIRVILICFSAGDFLQFSKLKLLFTTFIRLESSTKVTVRKVWKALLK